MPKLPKVLVGLPVGNMVEPGLVETLQRATELHSDEGYASPVQVISYRVTNQARNMLVERVLNGDWTHLFMLDDDMIYPAGTLAKLLQADKDIIAPFYVRKVRGFLPNAFADDAQGWHTLWCDTLVQVAAMGTGGMLIKREVFENILPQWFHYDIYPEPDKNRIEQKSEDVVFCDKAVQAGFEIWCDGRIKCGHVGTFVVWPGTEIEDKPGYGAVKVEPYEPLEINDYGY